VVLTTSREEDRDTEKQRARLHIHHFTGRQLECAGVCRPGYLCERTGRQN
jgi:hypothetical protein